MLSTSGSARLLIRSAYMGKRPPPLCCGGGKISQLRDAKTDGLGSSYDSVGVFYFLTSVHENNKSALLKAHPTLKAYRRIRKSHRNSQRGDVHKVLWAPVADNMAPKNRLPLINPVCKSTSIKPDSHSSYPAACADAYGCK